MGRTNELYQLRRLISIWVSPDALLRCISAGSKLPSHQVLVGWYLRGSITLEGEARVLPEDAVFVSCHENYDTRGLVVVVAHESFDPVPDGEQLPRWRFSPNSWNACILTRQEDGTYREFGDSLLVDPKAATAMHQCDTIVDKQPEESSGDWFRRTMSLE